MFVDRTNTGINDHALTDWSVSESFSAQNTVGLEKGKYTLKVVLQYQRPTGGEEIVPLEGDVVTLVLYSKSKQTIKISERVPKSL